MFGTFFFSGKKNIIGHVGSPESVNEMYWMYYQKETRCLFLRTTSFQSPGGEKLQWLPATFGVWPNLRFCNSFSALIHLNSQNFSLFQSVYWNVAIQKSCVPILPSIEVWIGCASPENSNGVCNLTQNDDPIPVPWEKTSSTSFLFKVFIFFGMTRCCPLWYPL